MNPAATACAPIAFDPDLGVIRLSRAHLDALVDRRAPTRPLDPQGSLADLEAVGALERDGRLHPALVGVVDVLGRARSRFFLRQWRRRGRRILEGVVGPDGIVVLPGGNDSGVPGDVWFDPRPTALARTLAGLIGLGPSTGEVRPPDDVLRWDEVRSLATDPPSWVTRSVGAGDDVCLHDVVWQHPSDGPRGSVLVLVDLGGTGLATVEAVDGNPACGYRLVARRPEEIWTGLCRLARSAP